MCSHVCMHYSLVCQSSSSKVLSLSGSLGPWCQPFKKQQWLLYAGTDRDRQPLSADVTSDRPPQLERLQRECWHFAVSVTKFHSFSPFHLLSFVILLFSRLTFLCWLPEVPQVRNVESFFRTCFSTKPTNSTLYIP